MRCHCTLEEHTPRLVAVTGGPGAGKTALLQLLQASFCRHVIVVPESATILYGGGFPRATTLEGRVVVQRAIYEVQRQLERFAVTAHRPAVAICDRGTLDGLAYWPVDDDAFWQEMSTTRDAELAKYVAVLHMASPADGEGYSYANPVRLESPEEAHRIDERLGAIWSRHPRYRRVAARRDFVEKLQEAAAWIAELVPECCRG
jgi:predicted ATPase